MAFHCEEASVFSIPCSCLVRISQKAEVEFAKVTLVIYTKNGWNWKQKGCFVKEFSYFFRFRAEKICRNFQPTNSQTGALNYSMRLYGPKKLGEFPHRFVATWGFWPTWQVGYQRWEGPPLPFWQVPRPRAWWVGRWFFGKLLVKKNIGSTYGYGRKNGRLTEIIHSYIIVI